MTVSQEADLTLTRLLDAPQELVYKCFTQPEHYAAWWGPEMFTTPVCELDARPGGAIQVAMRGPDGGTHAMTGSFEELVEFSRVVFKVGVPGADGNLLFENLNTIELSEEAGKTRLRLQVRVLSRTEMAAPMLKGMEAGWKSSLDRLEARAVGGDRGMVITRLMGASAEQMWAMWSDPVHVDAWFGPNGFRTVTKSMDFREGGTWLFTMHGPDGVDYPNKVVYRRLARPDMMVYQHSGGDDDPDPFEVFVTFAQEHGKLRVTLRSEFSSHEVRDTKRKFGAEELGGQTLARLAAHVASL